MQISKKYTVLSLVAVLGFGLIGRLDAMDNAFELVQKIYAAYNQKTNEFVGPLPVDRNDCEELLQGRKKLVNQLLNGLSYRSVLFSENGLSRMSVMLIGVLSGVAGHTRRLNMLQREIPGVVAQSLESPEGIDALNKSLMLRAEHPQFDESMLTFDEAKSMALSHLTKGLLSASGLFSRGENNIYGSRARFVIGGLGAMSAIAGFGLYKDIQAVRVQKNKLSAELDMIEKILELLKKA